MLKKVEIVPKLDSRTNPDVLSYLGQENAYIDHHKRFDFYQPRANNNASKHKSIHEQESSNNDKNSSVNKSVSIYLGGGGYTYLLEPLWWAGMVTMIIGEVANFVAYIYAPAVLVTPLGALSIIVSAVLAHFLLKERLQKMGILGCVSCIVGSVVIVIHAPQEQTPNSVQEIWDLATQPAFLVYVVATISVVLSLILHFEPLYGQTNMLVYLGICSLMGSLTVVSIKAIGIAIKLTLEGINQVTYPQTWFFLTVATICVITQLNYLNKALDTFNAAIVSPVYYVMFTTLTIIASAIMFKDWSGQNANNIASEVCGFITVLSGTIILHATRDQEQSKMQGTLTWCIGEDSM